MPEGKLLKSKSKRIKILKFALLSLALNLVFALYNGFMGVITHSVWLVALSAYYIILSVMRFSALVSVRRRTFDSTSCFIMKFSGVMLFVLSFVLSGTVYLSLKYSIATGYHEITMITIALYAFTKITLAIINVIKTRKSNAPILITLQNISLADAAVSIFTLQRSMLVSFDGMSADDIYIMNLLTGIAVCLFVFLLGLGMILKQRKEF